MTIYYKKGKGKGKAFYLISLLQVGLTLAEWADRRQ